MLWDLRVSACDWEGCACWWVTPAGDTLPYCQLPHGIRFKPRDTALTCLFHFQQFLWVRCWPSQMCGLWNSNQTQLQSPNCCWSCVCVLLLIFVSAGFSQLCSCIVLCNNYCTCSLPVSRVHVGFLRGNCNRTQLMSLPPPFILWDFVM